VRLDTDDEYPDVATIARFLTNPEGKKSRDDTSEHFQELVNAFFCGVLLYGLKSGIATTCADINDLVTRTHWPDLLTVMRAFDHPEVQRAAEVVSRIADRELSGVQTTAARALQIFSDPRVARMTSQATFRLTDLREAETPCTVYYSVPFADMERLRPLSRLLIRQVMGHITSRLTGWTHPVLVAIDELPSLDRLAILSDALNFAREFGVQLYYLTPSMEEVVNVYGSHHPFLEGTRVQLVYGLNDPDVARRFSRRIGAHTTQRTQTTVQHGGRGGSSTSRSDQEQPLFSETHVLKMPKESVLIAAGTTTVLADQARYFTTEPWRARSEIPPPLREETPVCGS
jgi:type IV secretion system protein VirD4